jgi:hypothetical protein
MASSVTAIGVPGQPMDNPPLTPWQAAVRDALNSSDVTVNARIASAFGARFWIGLGTTDAAGKFSVPMTGATFTAVPALFMTGLHPTRHILATTNSTLTSTTVAAGQVMQSDGTVWGVATAGFTVRILAIQL